MRIVDRHHADPDQTFHYDADQDPTATFTHVENKYFLFQAP